MKKILLILLILNSHLLSAQELEPKLRFGISGGFGTFNQGDPKSLNQDAIDQLPFEAKIIDEFKPNFNFGAYAQYQLFKRFWVGPEYRYYYTGSRLGQKDYSGVLFVRSVFACTCDWTKNGICGGRKLIGLVSRCS